MARRVERLSVGPSRVEREVRGVGNSPTRTVRCFTGGHVVILKSKRTSKKDLPGVEDSGEGAEFREHPPCVFATNFADGMRVTWDPQEGAAHVTEGVVVTSLRQDGSIVQEHHVRCRSMLNLAHTGWFSLDLLCPFFLFRVIAAWAQVLEAPRKDCSLPVATPARHRPHDKSSSTKVERKRVLRRTGSVICHFSDGSTEVRNVRGCLATAAPGSASWSITNVDGTVLEWTEGQAFGDVSPADPEDNVDGTGSDAIEAILDRLEQAKRDAEQAAANGTSMAVPAAAVPTTTENGPAVGGAPAHPSDAPNDGLWRLDPLVGGRVCASGEGSSAMVAVEYFSGNRACFFGDGTAIFASVAPIRGPETVATEFERIEVQCPNKTFGVATLTADRLNVLLASGCSIAAELGSLSGGRHRHTNSHPNSPKWTVVRRDGVVVAMDAGSGVAHLHGGEFNEPAGPIAANLRKGELAVRQHNCALLSLFQVRDSFVFFRALFAFRMQLE